MQALKCDFCGSSLIMDPSCEFATCEYCGTKYLKETIQNKIQEIRGEVKISGAVETITGSAEKERLVKNAKTYIGIREYDKALETYSQIIRQFPDDYRGWWGTFTTPIEQYFATGRFNAQKGSQLKNAYTLCQNKDILIDYFKSVINRYGIRLRVVSCTDKISLILVNNSETPMALDSFTSWLIFGQTSNIKFYPEFFKNFITDLSNKYVEGTKNGTLYASPTCCIAPFANNNCYISFGAYNLASAVSFISKENGARHSEAFINPNEPKKTFYKIGWGNNYVDVTAISGAYGRWLFTLNKNRLPVAVMMKKTITITDIYRYSGRCQHCGGKFKGAFTKTCTQCGKVKDY